MDVIDILGSMLGHKSSEPGKGTDVLTDILRRGSQSKAPTTPKAPPSSSASGPIDIERDARQLEELLQVANDRRASSRSGAAQTGSTPPPNVVLPPQRSEPTRRDTPLERKPQPASDENERAIVLVRAMVNAAKSDGKIDPVEQERILSRLSNPSPDAIEFLRAEFARPLNLREFAASVPAGMEQQVYMLSLVAIDLDTGQEAKYLLELSEALRLPVDVREQIHQRLGAPSIY